MKCIASIFFIIQFLFLGVCSLLSQTAPGKYWIRFTDKDNSAYSLSRPQEFLSAKCIDRRMAQGIGFDVLDLPVNQSYIDEVLSMGPGILHHRSKWFNAITVITEDSTWLEEVRLLPFVAEVRAARVGGQTVFKDKWSVEENEVRSGTEQLPCDSFPEYGRAWRQTEMLNVQWLHNLGYRGAGVDIAQFDAGWSRTDILPVFERLRSEGRIKMTRDFVWSDNPNIYTYNSHGTSVLSIMAGWLPGEMVGAAPEANYFLFRTEDPFSEFPVETDNWVVAAELCDSLGIDIINSSLGYSLFDDSAYDFTYDEMNGSTIHNSIAAGIAARKGILVVNSAGNSGDDPWRYLTAPSDAEGILAVGAADAQENHAWFSSYGPAADGRVKPDVSAMGAATAYAAQDSTIRTGNGTSFSSPLIAASTACLLQAFPSTPSHALRDAVIRSASAYMAPTDSLGYGIPDYYIAWKMLRGEGLETGDFGASVFPNPCTHALRVTLDDAKSCAVEFTLYDAIGRRVVTSSGVAVTDGHGSFSMDDVVSRLPAGRYTLHVHWELRNSVVSFTKISTP
jgi:subtilisin family serine protease